MAETSILALIFLIRMVGGSMATIGSVLFVMYDGRGWAACGIIGAWIVGVYAQPITSLK